MKCVCTTLPFFFLLIFWPCAAKYVVYPLFRAQGCNSELCSEDFTCEHTCYLHGLECSTTNFDCYAEAVKYCGGKELTMLIESHCATDLCDVDCDLGVYYSSREHGGGALCDGGMAPFCPRSNWAQSLCQCELPAASEDLFKKQVALQVSLNYKFVGFVAFGVLVLGLVASRIRRKCCSSGGEADEVSFSESELAFLGMESNRRGVDHDDDDDDEHASSDGLLRGESGAGDSSRAGKSKSKSQSKNSSKSPGSSLIEEGTKRKRKSKQKEISKS